MFVSFNTLPDEARVWIYQASRALSSEEQQLILSTGKIFMDQWEAHGQPLTASIDVLEGYFVIISVDKYHQLPTGCSIDESVAFMRSLGEQLKVDFFGRSKVAIWANDSVQLVSIAEIKQNIKNGKVQEETKLFDTLVQKKAGLKNWILPLKDSWLGRYLPQTTG